MDNAPVAIVTIALLVGIGEPSKVQTKFKVPLPVVETEKFVIPPWQMVASLKPVAAVGSGIDRVV